jgi:hypothetical protein
VVRYFPLRTRAGLRRSAINAMPAPMTMRASVALELPGATQLMQVPMMAGASNGGALQAEGENSARARFISAIGGQQAAFAVNFLREDAV